MKNVYLGIIALLIVGFGVSWAFPDSRELMIKSLFKAPDNDEIPMPKKKTSNKTDVPLPKGRQGASTISHRPAVLIPFMAAATSLNRCAPYHFHRIQITSCRLHETTFSHTNHL